MMIHSRTFLLYLIFFLSPCRKIVSADSASSIGDNNIKTRCIDEEREALLIFKNGVVDPTGRLSSWNTQEDCCKWSGIQCSNRSGHVVMLNLPAWLPFETKMRILGGNISSSLLELKEMNYLDLSFNAFATIPAFIGSLINLRYLNLSRSFYSNGTVPSEFGNLSKLRYLDLSQNYFTKIEEIEWLSHLSLLKYLDISSMDLSSLPNWANGIDMLPSLVELKLQFSKLPNVSSASLLSINSSKSLAVVDLSGNTLSSSIFPWLCKFSTSLTEINLSINRLCGAIPDTFSNFSNLRSLDMSYNCLNESLPMFLKKLPANSLEILRVTANSLSGSLPDFTRFSSLRELALNDNQIDGTFPQNFEQVSGLIVLDLSGNEINGSLPDLAMLSSLRELFLMRNLINGSLTSSIRQLSKLEILDVSWNSLEGIITEAHLSNLSSLQHLDLSFNSLALKMSNAWVPTFQLDSLRLSSCNLGPSFPKWLQTQNNLSVLDISVAGISDTAPNWFWDLSSRLRNLNLSQNQIRGVLPDLSSKFGSSPRIDLSSNNFSGPIPLVPLNVSLLNLSKNRFSGSISFLCRISSPSLMILDLSDNLLSEELPDCWMHVKDLAILNLANNQFTGKLPISIGSLHFIRMLTVRNNSISGELPSSLKNCTYLKLLDLGDNGLSGEIPEWLGRSIPDLVVVRLRSNEFHGTLPSTLCNLANIQVLDLSMNNISGMIPKCINNFTAMVKREGVDVILSFSYPEYDRILNMDPHVYRGRTFIFNVLLEWKGRQSEYRNTLGLVKLLDLSSNSLSGEIPDAIMSLVGLIALNLSRNSLTGTISPNIDQLRWLDFLDLSTNQLSGQIPTSFSQLSNLGVLDLSKNNLSGRIPLSTQLQSFDTSVYAGNPGLCGLPLIKSCEGDEAPQDPTITTGKNEADGSEDKLLTTGFYVSMVPGFAFGFWGLCGTLLLNDKWRYAYYMFLNRIQDWVCVTTSVNMARLQRRRQASGFTS